MRNALFSTWLLFSFSIVFFSEPEPGVPHPFGEQ